MQSVLYCKLIGGKTIKKALSLVLAVLLSTGLCFTGSSIVKAEESAHLNIEWSDFIFSVKDVEGYLYEVTYHFSPWILFSNTEILNAAWSKVGKNNTLPGFDDWGLEKKNNAYWRQLRKKDLYTSYGNFSAPMSDMYYCVGTVTITNKTDGFDITRSSPRSVILPLSLEFEDIYDWAPVIGRIYYFSELSDRYSCIYTSAKMDSNTWGPATVLFMAPENYSPNYPDGQFCEPLLNSAYFSGYFGSIENMKWNGEDITFRDYPRVGLIGKDGVYTTE